MRAHTVGSLVAAWYPGRRWRGLHVDVDGQLIVLCIFGCTTLKMQSVLPLSLSPTLPLELEMPGCVVQ